MTVAFLNSDLMRAYTCYAVSRSISEVASSIITILFLHRIAYIRHNNWSSPEDKFAPFSSTL